MSVQRSPSSTEKTISHTQSESDLTTAAHLSDTPYSYVNTKRNIKRSRPNEPGSPEHGVHQDFKQEIMSLLNNWKTELDAKLSEMFLKQNNLISQLCTDISELKLQNSSMQKAYEEIDKSMKFMNLQYEDIKSEVENLQKERLLERKCIENLERKVQDFHFKSRSSTVEIRNVPQVDNETSAELTNVVCKISQVIGSATSSLELRDIYRIPGKPNTIRPIVAEFHTVQTKQKMLAAVRVFNSKKTLPEDKLHSELLNIPGKRLPVYIGEHLPASSKKLFYLSKEFAKQNDYKYCWTTNGNIFLRKVQGDKQLHVSSEQVLLDLRTVKI